METREEEGKGLAHGFTRVYRLVSTVSTVSDKSHSERAECVFSLSFLDGSRCRSVTEQKTEQQLDVSEHIHIEAGQKNSLRHPVF